MPKIKVHNVKDILKVFQKLTSQRFEITLALKMSKVKKELQEILETLGNQERALFDKYMKKDPKTGRFVVEGDNLVFNTDDPKKIRTFNDEMNNLHSTEVELESLTSPIILNNSHIANLVDITPDDILALEGIVEFVIEEPKENPENNQETGDNQQA